MYISAHTLGHLAIPALMAGGGYATLGAGLLLGKDSHHHGLPHLGLHVGHHGLGLHLGHGHHHHRKLFIYNE
jgi:hypothetical protein